MSAKFHVNGRGEAGACRAEKGFCPFGDDENHFASVAEARSAYEALQGSPLRPGVQKQHEEIVARTNWNYDDAPKTGPGVVGEEHPYLDVSFSRERDDKLTLTGREDRVRAYLRELDALDAEKLTHLRSIHTKNPRISTKLSKWQQKFYGQWEDRGFSRVGALPEHERNIVDINLDYVNGARQVDRSKPDLQGYHRPYTNLYSYAPNMKGSAGTWIRTDLKFDHATGNFYGVTTVEGMPRSLMGKRTAMVKVEDYGQDFEAAMRGTQEQSDSAIQTYLDSEPKAKLEGLGKRESWYNDPLQEHTPQENAFTNHRELVRKELAKGITEAREWNRLKRERENLTPNDEVTIAAAGY